MEEFKRDFCMLASERCENKTWHNARVTISGVELWKHFAEVLGQSCIQLHSPYPTLHR